MAQKVDVSGGGMFGFQVTLGVLAALFLVFCILPTAAVVGCGVITVGGANAAARNAERRKAEVDAEFARQDAEKAAVDAAAKKKAADAKAADERAAAIKAELARPLKVNDKGKLTGPDGFVAVAAEEADAVAYAKAKAEGDVATDARLTREDRVVFLKVGTKLRIKSLGKTIAEVEVIDGERKGGRFFVAVSGIEKIVE